LSLTRKSSTKGRGREMVQKVKREVERRRREDCIFSSEKRWNVRGFREGKEEDTAPHPAGKTRQEEGGHTILYIRGGEKKKKDTTCVSCGRKKE